MNAFEKIKRSWWVLLSFIPFLNGLGFLYIAITHSNRNWFVEFATYELPWVLYFIYYARFGNPNLDFYSPSSLILLIALLLYFIGIIRSFWVAVKLADVYDNEEKYVIQTTDLSKSNSGKEKDNHKTNLGCCLCIIVLFIMFVIAVL
jgi:hypothetical protein